MVTLWIEDHSPWRSSSHYLRLSACPRQVNPLKFLINLIAFYYLDLTLCATFIFYQQILFDYNSKILYVHW